MEKTARRTSPVVAALLAALSAGAGASAADRRGIDLELQTVSDAVAQLRSRPFKTSVPTRSMSCSLASLRLMEIARQEGARCSPDIERAVVALGFIEHDLAPPLGAAPSENRLARPEEDEEDHASCGLAFYDQIKKEVVVIDGRSAPEERDEVLAHELSHALQDQLFDLRAHLKTLTRTASGDHDAEELAVNAALNEGEATAIELLYLWKRGSEQSFIQGVALGDPLSAATVLAGGLAPAPQRRFAAGMRSVQRGARAAWAQQLRPGSKNYFQALARFQYLVGASFVAEAYARGGWELVDRIREEPPSSTAQLLHPELFFGEKIERPVLVDPGSFLAANPRGRYRLLYENRLGELGAMVAIEDEARGWRGDVFRVIGRADDGPPVVEARSLWSDAGSAGRFLSKSTRWLRSMKLETGSFDLLDRRGAAVVLGAGLRAEELSSFRRAAWLGRARAPIQTEGGKPGEDRTLGLRRRAADGSSECDLRLLEPGERARALEVLKAHCDRSAKATLDTDGKTWGVRTRPGGGVSWVQDRPDGRIIVATGKDRSSVQATISALSEVAPAEKKVRIPRP